MLRRALSLTLAIASTASMAFVPIGHAAAIGGNAYRVTRLVSDGSGATHTDPNLVGAWGLAAGRRTPWVVSDVATNVSTSYAGTGSANRQILSVPFTPTGVAFNGTSSFVVSDGRSSAPSTFLFSTLDGTIRG